jgi:enoyl-[acyl-carrier protein] reductase I
MGLLEGKNAIIYGVANRRSIGWGIAQALHREGARIALSYANERLASMVRECADQIPGTILLQADVTRDGEIEAVYEQLGSQWEQLDIVVHSVAWAPPEELKGRFLDTSREGFRAALDISAYSLIPVTRHAVPLMKNGGSVVTMTFIASQRVFPSYNVMGVAKAALESAVRYLAADLGPQGIRVNSISAGPISTLAARGIKGFTGFANVNAERAPLRRNTDQHEVGDMAVFLASDLSRGTTGETLYVDEGFHVLGV